jgi:hypothetical protein
VKHRDAFQFKVKRHGHVAPTIAADCSDVGKSSYLENSTTPIEAAQISEVWRVVPKSSIR